MQDLERDWTSWLSWHEGSKRTRQDGSATSLALKLAGQCEPALLP